MLEVVPPSCSASSVRQPGNRRRSVHPLDAPLPCQRGSSQAATHQGSASARV